MACIAFESVLVNINIISTLGYFGSTLEYVGSTLEYIGSTFVYVGYVGRILDYVRSVLECITLVRILVNIRINLGYFESSLG